MYDIENQKRERKQLEIKHQKYDETKGEFIALDGAKQAGAMTYTWAGSDKLIADHTEVADDYRGQNVGMELMEALVEFARAETVKIIPLCPFVASVFKKRSDIQDLLHK